MKRRIRTSLAVFVAVVTTLMSFAGLVATSHSAAAAVVDPEQDMLLKTNQARTAVGLAPLQWDANAANIARWWSQQMANAGTLSHNPYLVDQVNSQVTTQWTRIGENVGYGPDTTTIQNAFMNSAPHRANILGDYNRVGIGVAYDGAGRMWVTLDFIKGPSLGDPIGSFDYIWQIANGVRVGGWAIDPDTASPIEVHVYVDSSGANLGLASLSRPDVGAAYPGYGDNHGFDGVVYASPGWHTICAWGINVSNGANKVLGCKAALVHGDPFGQFDAAVQVLGGIRVSGWAIDPETSSPIEVHVYIDNYGVNTGPANKSRPDVGSYYAWGNYGSAHGFDTVINWTPGVHSVCAYGINAGAGGGNTLLGCKYVTVDPSPFGRVDVVAPVNNGIRVTGWDIDPDTASPVEVHVYIDGGGTNLGPASKLRSDVGSYFAYAGWGANHGFDSVLSAAKGSHQVCVYAINVMSGANRLLTCKSVTV